MALALLFIPLAGAILALTLPSNRLRPFILPVSAAFHLGFTVALLGGWIAPLSGDWFWLDPPGRLVLGLVSALFFGCSIYAVEYLRFREDRSNRVFVACFNGLLGSITLTVFARNLGLMWVAIEASALAGAPLIYFNHNARSIEATWKYLMVGSVGIALALLGTFFLAYAAIQSGAPVSLRLDELTAMAPQLSVPWMKAAFVLILVGYGTKMGLAPMHTWKPDAYGEAPGVVGAIFAGGVTSATFLAILRVLRICSAAGEGLFARELLIILGLFSMALAGALMAGQKDFKRMLAYSSVEHMGILVLGIGIGGLATFGALLHLLCNGLAKGVMFLSAGNLHRAYGSKTSDEVTGAMQKMPVSGTLFLVAFFVITGAPPFGLFVSELCILRGAFSTGHGVAGWLFLIFLMVVFIGMGRTVLKITLGKASGPAPRWKDQALTSIPMFGFLAAVLLLGIFIPEPLNMLLKDAAVWVGGVP